MLTKDVIVICNNSRRHSIVILRISVGITHKAANVAHVLKISLFTNMLHKKIRSNLAREINLHILLSIESSSQSVDTYLYSYVVTPFVNVPNSAIIDWIFDIVRKLRLVKASYFC